ncbi:hypothetical protein P4X70_004487 [Salmonella enterica]|nr:hypothetical protein [Salmonella enterica]
MAKKERYVVMVKDKTKYSGNQRFLAWLVWFANRHNKAAAYDNAVWIVEPSYWLRIGSPH